MAKVTAVVADDLIPRSARTSTPQRGGVASEDLIPMQFKMPESFATEFRTTATANRMKYNELLQECFDAWKREKNING